MLPFEPGDIHGVFIGTDDGEAIADLHTFVASAINIDIIASGPGDLGVGFFTGDDANVVGDLVGDKPGAIDGGVIGRIGS